jgi:ABC-type branched-subunit amino acid transport system ATPase component
MTPDLFAFTTVSGGYGGAIVVRDVSGRVAAGEVLAVTGRNGVGKSTLMKLLYGYLPLRDGTVTFQDKDLADAPPPRRSTAGITYCPQERIVFENLSVWENLALMQPALKPDAFAPYFERFPRLRERLQQRAGTLSGGERKILSCVRGLSERKPLALLDEPTEGVQQENIEHMAALIGEAKAQGRAFIIVEQNLDFIDAIADALIVMDQGRIVLEGRANEIGRDQIAAHLSV